MYAGLLLISCRVWAPSGDWASQPGVALMRPSSSVMGAMFSQEGAAGFAWTDFGVGFSADFSAGVWATCDEEMLPDGRLALPSSVAFGRTSKAAAPFVSVALGTTVAFAASAALVCSRGLGCASVAFAGATTGLAGISGSFLVGVCILDSTGTDPDGAIGCGGVAGAEAAAGVGVAAVAGVPPV